MFMDRRGRLLAAILGLGLGWIAATRPARAETLADAIALAYDSNPTLQAQRATQRALDENYVQARSGYRPTLSLTVQGNYLQTRTPGLTGQPVDVNGDGVPDLLGQGIEESNTGTAALSITQPIYTGGRVAAAVSAANADILAGRENLRRVEAQVLANVVQAYVDVRRDQQALSIQQENLEVLQRQLDESRARFDVGEITRTDVAQSEARLAASQAALQSAQAQLAVSRSNYAAAVGQNPGELAPEPPLDGLLPKDVDQAYDLAEANNPQIRSAEYAEQASKARVAGARAERMPELGLRGTWGYNGATRPLNTDLWSQEITAAAVVSVPLFTGGLTNSRVRQQIERNNTDRINIEAARRSVIQSITQAWNQLLAARANIASTGEQVRAARIAAEGTKQELQVGLRTTLDVLNAEQELRAAELAQVAARRDAYIASAAVIGGMGRLEARNLNPAAPQYDPKTHFSKLRVTWGWVPWEEPIAVLDSALTPRSKEIPLEPAVAKAPSAASPVAAPSAN
jgi:outer membrane protein